MRVGRRAERRRIASLLAAARKGRSAALIVRGEAGIGKTDLLRYARERAEGMTVLSARGVEAESQLPFAGLSQLLRPALAHLDRIPEPQAAALAGALALGPPAPGDRFAVASATLGLLAAKAEVRPVLTLVDDAHWLDAGSRDALLFTARRLVAEGLVLLFGLRDEAPEGFDRTGVDELVLGGLDPESCEHLLAARGFTRPAPAVLEQLVEATGGNPLALIESCELLSPAQLKGAEPLTEPLPVGLGIAGTFARQLEPLPAATKRALLLASASELPALDGMPFEPLGIEPGAFAPAEAAGLVRLEDGRLEWQHPLVRSAVYQTTAPAERRAAHRALAAVLGEDTLGDRRAWHLAGAAVGPDEDVARALEESASGARARRGHAAAAAALERAARLSPDGEQRARRLLEAARDLELAGRPEHAAEHLGDALALTDDPLVRADIQFLAGWIGMWTATPRESHRLLAAEAERVRALDAARAARMLAVAARASVMAGEVRQAVGTAERAVRLAKGEGAAERAAAALALGLALALKGDSKRGRRLLDRCSELLETGDPLLVNLIQPLVWLEDYESARDLADALVDAARRAGIVGLLPFALASRAELRFRTGRLAAAYADAAEAVELAEEVGQQVTASFGLVCLARVEAAQGREPDARSHVEQALELADARGIDSIATYGHSVLGLLELGLGRPDEALPHLEEATGLLESHGVGEPCVMQVAPDRVAACVLAGRKDDASHALALFEDEVARRPSPWGRAAAARCRGLLATEDAFEPEFGEALRWHEQTPTPFERARTELRLGERLRRAKRLSEARDALRRALGTFERLGAAPWAQQARAELTASGGRQRRRPAPGLELLSPQELQIALLVAEGATNREIAAALFISPRTVQFHLGKVFRRLGLRSRTELTRLIMSAEAGYAQARA